jgi:hypothetical protein
MGRNVSCFMAPDEVRNLLKAACQTHGWGLWLFSASAENAPLRRVDRLDEAGQGMVWVGTMPHGVLEWNARDASIEAGFACLVSPLLGSDERGTYLTMTEVFDVGVSRVGRCATFPRLKAALATRTLGNAWAVSDESGAKSSTNVGYTADALALWQSGVQLRQVGKGNVHFTPAEQVDPRQTT